MIAFNQRRDGFTVLEVLLVMAIMLIIMAVAYPTLESMYADSRVQAAADDVRGAWAEARARAIDSRTPYRFSVKPNTSAYRVAPDLQEYWDGSGDASAAGQANNVKIDDGKVISGWLPKDIKFKMDNAGAETSGGWQTVARFLPDGTCKDDAQVTLDADGCHPLVVSVRSLTGITRVQRQDQVNKVNP